MGITKKRILAFCLSLVMTLSFFIGSLPLAYSGQAQDNGLWSEQVGIEEVGSSAYGQSGQSPDIRVTVIKIINIVLGILAIIFFALVLFAGFKYMTAGGNEDRAKEAISYITNATIGLVIILAAWAISYFLLVRLRAITMGQTSYLTGPYYH